MTTIPRAMQTKRDKTQGIPAQSRSQAGAPKCSQLSRPPYNPGLQQLVTGKQSWAVPLDEDAKAKGFLGWHQRSYLPHYDAPGITQIITLRLADSLPASRRREWEHLLQIENLRERRRKLEEYLDRSLGDCWLRQPAIASLAEGALRHFDGQRYALAAWVIMPNHLHALVDVWDTPLSELIKSWKAFVAHEANKLLGRRGEFWEREYLDTVIENNAHHRTAVSYIENNPAKAGLVREAKEWPWSSARFRDELGRLKYPVARSRSKSGAPQGDGAPTCSRLRPWRNK
ncbi:MAG TPA: transposase [Verrucomicrobiae bacterium]|nr:transposase [Verrucomicrobiae bacterium]